MKVINVVGARPNFMKIAPILAEMKRRPGFEPMLLHTGQHYDEEMSKVFFTDLGLPKPDVYLGVGGGSHAEQTARIMLGFDPILDQFQPDCVLVVGDVNSTIACALVAVKRGVRVAHVEAGLRSGDRAMPEEINRILTDSISDYLLIPSADAEPNLLREGIPSERIFLVGNVMVDCLLQHKRKAMESPVLADLGLEPGGYALLTLHRPSNVDDVSSFAPILEALAVVQERVKIVFPVHPRTRHKLEESSLAALIARMPNLIMTRPQGYLDFLRLMVSARLVLTDSGGIQEETTALGVPCLTLRNNTERPITISEGTNVLVGTRKERIIEESLKVLDGGGKPPACPALWDGRAAERIAQVLERQLSGPAFPGIMKPQLHTPRRL